MALTIIFSIGLRAGDSGFKLGRRAIDAADADLSISDLRTVLESFSYRSPGTFRSPADQTIDGTAVELSGEAVLLRATPCGPRGWSGRMTLAIETQGAETVVLCRRGGVTSEFARFRGPAAFEYSLDGLSWNSAFASERDDPTALDEGGEVRAPRQVLVRLNAVGRQVVARVSTGWPRSWDRADEEI